MTWSRYPTGKKAVDPALQAEIEALKQIVEMERKRADELRLERDRWVAEASQRQITHFAEKHRQDWWPWKRRA